MHSQLFRSTKGDTTTEAIHVVDITVGQRPRVSLHIVQWHSGMNGAPLRCIGPAVTIAYDCDGIIICRRKEAFVRCASSVLAAAHTRKSVVPGGSVPTLVRGAARAGAAMVTLNPQIAAYFYAGQIVFDFRAEGCKVIVSARDVGGWMRGEDDAALVSVEALAHAS